MLSGVWEKEGQDSACMFLECTEFQRGMIWNVCSGGGSFYLFHDSNTTMVCRYRSSRRSFLRKRSANRSLGVGVRAGYWGGEMKETVPEPKSNWSPAQSQWGWTPPLHSTIWNKSLNPAPIVVLHSCHTGTYWTKPAASWTEIAFILLFCCTASDSLTVLGTTDGQLKCVSDFTNMTYRYGNVSYSTVLS